MGKDLHIILMKGIIPELDFKIDMFIHYLDKEGIDYYVADTTSLDTIGEELIKYIEQGNCLMFTFNNYGIDWTFDGDNLWNRCSIPVFTYLVDHPRYFSDVLLNPLCDVYVICCDKNHTEFVRNYYDKVKDAFYFPQGGTEINSNTTPSQRAIEVIYMGCCKRSYEETAVLPTIASFAEEYYSYCLGTLFADPSRTTEDAIKSFFDSKQLSITKDQLLDLYISTAHYIEQNVRRVFQLMIYHALDDAGIHVEIYGEGWEDTDNPFSDNIVIHGIVSVEKILEKLANSKISLCFVPWFKRGCSEKNYDSLINGALCITDESECLKERYSDGENIIFFDLRKPEQMAADVKWLLEHPQQLDAIAGRGRYIAKRYDSWNNRYKDICQLMKEIIEK